MSDSYASSAEVAALVELVNTAAKTFEAADGGDSHVARRELHLQAKKLVASLEEPNKEVWPRIFQINVSVAVDIVTDLGLWSKFEGGKTISLAEIVDSTGADEIMIVRIFRQLVAAGVLADIPGPGYSITAVGIPYLNPDHQNFNKYILDSTIPTILAMPRALRERGYKVPTKESGSPFKWLSGEEKWKWLASHPDLAAAMVSGMRSINAGNVSGDAYPFGTELTKLDIKDDEVAIVDIGGGQGHVLEEIRKKIPEIRGRFICQDFQSTFDVVSGPPHGVEFLVYDFFKPQPIKKAYFYYMRHIVHDWNDEECHIILRHIVQVLRENPKSKLLLVDLVLPDTNVTLQDCISDINMYPIGGLERNVKQWTTLLAVVGLKIKKIWRGSEPEACIECELETNK